jgi:16S rRNA (cytidine1402-2'-O)-methyltransferase
VTAVLCVAGLPTDAFVFVGFLPKKAGGRKKRLTALSAYPETLIFFESPRRILRLIAEVREIMGDREGFLAREMTKPHETFYRGRLSAVEAAAAEGGIKGECTLLVAGASAAQKAALPDAAAAELNTRLLREPLSEAVRAVAKKYCLSRKIVYNAALEMREKSGSNDTSKSPEPDTANCCNTKK